MSVPYSIGSCPHVGLGHFSPASCQSRLYSAPLRTWGGVPLCAFVGITPFAVLVDAHVHHRAASIRGQTPLRSSHHDSGRYAQLLPAGEDSPVARQRARLPAQTLRKTADTAVHDRDIPVNSRRGTPPRRPLSALPITHMGKDGRTGGSQAHQAEKHQRDYDEHN